MLWYIMTNNQIRHTVQYHCHHIRARRIIIWSLSILHWYQQPGQPWRAHKSNSQRMVWLWLRSGIISLISEDLLLVFDTNWSSPVIRKVFDIQGSLIFCKSQGGFHHRLLPASELSNSIFFFSISTLQPCCAVAVVGPTVCEHATVTSCFCFPLEYWAASRGCDFHAAMWSDVGVVVWYASRGKLMVDSLLSHNSPWRWFYLYCSLYFPFTFCSPMYIILQQSC